MTETYLCSIGSSWIACLFLQVWNFYHSAFSFLGICWDIADMYVSLPSHKLFEKQQLTHSLPQMKLVAVCEVMSFWARPPLVSMDMHNFVSCAISFSVTCWKFTIFQLIYFIIFISPFQHGISCRDCLNCSRVQSLMISSSWLSVQMLHLVIGPFIFKVLFPSSCSGTWSGSICKVHISLQEFQAVELMLHKIASQVCHKVVAFHLDNSTAKVYLCNQCGMTLPFLSRLAHHILNLANKHGITLIPVYIPTYLSVEVDYLSLGRHLLPHIVWAVFQPSGQSQVDLLAYLHTSQCYYTLEIPGELCVSSCISSIQDSGRTCQRSVQTSYSSGTLLDIGP